MKCSERLVELGIKILEVHPKGCEFVCSGENAIDVCEILESLDFWDYTSPLGEFDLRPPWWSVQHDPDDERIFIVMGDPSQEVD